MEEVFYAVQWVLILRPVFTENFHETVVDILKIISFSKRHYIETDSTGLLMFVFLLLILLLLWPSLYVTLAKNLLQYLCGSVACYSNLLQSKKNKNLQKQQIHRNHKELNKYHSCNDKGINKIPLLNTKRFLKNI